MAKLLMPLTNTNRIRKYFKTPPNGSPKIREEQR
jgi:hypothetical protein